MPHLPDGRLQGRSRPTARQSLPCRCCAEVEKHHGWLRFVDGWFFAWTSAERIDEGPSRVTPAGCDRTESAVPAATPARRTRPFQTGAAVVSLATDRLSAAPIINGLLLRNPPRSGGRSPHPRMSRHPTAGGGQTAKSRERPAGRAGSGRVPRRGCCVWYVGRHDGRLHSRDSSGSSAPA